MSGTPDTTQIALDAMGADKGPSVLVEAASLALRAHPALGRLLLVGQTEILKPLLARYDLDNDPRVEIVHASEVIGMDEKPIASLRQKKDASLLRAVELVKEHRAHGVISCGNTGALMAAGTLRLRPEEGIERPALGLVLPSHNHHAILIDAGANPDSTPLQLTHNAILGSLYCQALLQRDHPRVGLLTIGTEEGKGNERIQETHALLKKLDGAVLRYCGLVEGFDVFDNSVDVIVTDGFTGNVLLKTCEALFYMLKSYLGDELTKNPARLLGAALCRNAFRDIKKQLSPDRYGGAQLLGVRGLVMKAHGSSNPEAICSALGIAARITRTDLATRIRTDIAKANALIKNQPVSTSP